MEKIARRNIKAIYENWRIFRRILKRDLVLDRMSGQRRGNRRRVVGEDNLGGGFEIRSGAPTVDENLVGKRMDISNLVGDLAP